MRTTSSGKNGNRIVLMLIEITTVLLFLVLYTTVSKKNNNPNSKVDSKSISITEVPKTASCTRTTRLDNKPVYDRALSFIGEKYLGWDKDYLKSVYSYSYFPSQLVNCIKVEERNLRNTTGEEGNFIFNGDRIKENYYPITVDQDYSYNDEAINALLLVHEITHVQQFINSLNNKEKLSCIDMEVEAFMAQLKFYYFQFPEPRKTIVLRIENDQNLHPQLQILKDLLEQLRLNFDKRRQEILNGTSNSDSGIRADNFDKILIRGILMQNSEYKKQCGI